MTPEERKLVDDLFDRLTRLETAPRDTEAETAITEGLKRAPHAIYALVQTVLVQDEALRRADARIRELTNAAEGSLERGSFLDSMRQAFTGRTSVPTVRPTGANESASRANSENFSNGFAQGPGAFQNAGSSFLGTAAASAVGVMGGALLLNSISSMFGHNGANTFVANANHARSPWDNSAANSDLARDAGLNDIGKADNYASKDLDSASLFNVDSNATGDVGNDGDWDGDFSGDFGSDFGDA